MFRWFATLSLVLIAAPSGAEAPTLHPPRIERTTPKAPWFRRAPVPGTRKPTGGGLIDQTRWPAEPPSPTPVDPKRLGDALATECAYMPPKRRAKWPEWILESASEFGVDPFLVAAILTEEGACSPTLKSARGIGLSGMQVELHSGYIKKRSYRYWVLDAGRWVERQKPMKRHLFYERSLELSRSAIYFTAGILAVLGEQCPGIDGAFGSVPHRHPVSHFVWGDRVRGADDEDRILAARRRLLINYGAGTEPTRGTWRDLALRSPLDGTPRKLTSVWGDERDGGKRTHVGVDFASTRGEPVRAIAAGQVFFAGAEVRGRGSVNMTFADAQKIARKDLGKAGFFVKIKHPGGLVSAHMHLDEYAVVPGQHVAQGELIGRAGRSGIKDSAAHLHFELRHDGERIDPEPHFGDLVIPPSATWRGRRLEVERKRLKRRRRRR